VKALRLRELPYRTAIGITTADGHDAIELLGQLAKIELGIQGFQDHSLTRAQLDVGLQEAALPTDQDNTHIDELATLYPRYDTDDSILI
jgi:hypothetical protein